MPLSETLKSFFGGSRQDRDFLPAALEVIETPASPTGRLIAGFIIAFFVIALAWSCLGRIDIIATAQGKIVPTGKVKTVQPLEAGTITAIRVKDGDKVKEGESLILLDTTLVNADRNRVMVELLRARLDVARLTALRDSPEGDIASERFVLPVDAPAYEIARTRANMLAQAAQQKAKIASLDEQIAQKEAELASIAAATAKLEASLPLIEQTADLRQKAMQIEYGNKIAHLDAQMKLSDQRNDLIIQKRRAVETEAARRALIAQRDQTRAEYSRGLTNDLTEAEQKVGQLSEDLIKTDRKIADLTLRAPIEGTVQQLAVHTIGGVVTPAQMLMAVVPKDAGIEIEAMLQNKDIGFVLEGDPAEVKIDTFNFTKYGLIHGEVVTVSRDAISRDKPQAGNASATSLANAQRNSSEPAGQELVYAARIRLDEASMSVEGRDVALSPGMAVTVEIKTGRRRIIEFLLSPVLRYRQEALRER